MSVFDKLKYGVERQQSTAAENKQKIRNLTNKKCGKSCDVNNSDDVSTKEPIKTNIMCIGAGSRLNKSSTTGAKTSSSDTETDIKLGDDETTDVNRVAYGRIYRST